MIATNPGNRAVAAHADVDRAGPELHRSRGTEHSGGGGEVRDQEDLREAPVEGVQGRARVEPEPAEPQDQHPEPEQGHAVAGNCPRCSVGVVLAAASAEQEQRGERAAGADQMDRRRAGEVLHADDAGTQPVTDLQEPTAEHPVGAERVDDAREHDRVGDVGPELDPLERCSPHDRQRDGAERELEEELRVDRRVRQRHHREVGTEHRRPPPPRPCTGRGR